MYPWFFQIAHAAQILLNVPELRYEQACYLFQIVLAFIIWQNCWYMVPYELEILTNQKPRKICITSVTMHDAHIAKLPSVSLQLQFAVLQFFSNMFVYCIVDYFSVRITLIITISIDILQWHSNHAMYKQRKHQILDYRVI